MLKKLQIYNKIPLVRRSAVAQNLQPNRVYCQSTKTCWSCNATLRHSGDIFCASCKKIQKIPHQLVSFLQFSFQSCNHLRKLKIGRLIYLQDYFNLFGIKRQHAIDANDLTTIFRSFQSQIHPDKFSGKTEEEQTLSSEWSSLINKAYKVLQAPLERGEYLLGLHGVTLPEGNTITDPEFLMEMMEKNEEVRRKKKLIGIIKKFRNFRYKTPQPKKNSRKFFSTSARKFSKFPVTSRRIINQEILRKRSCSSSK